MLEEREVRDISSPSISVHTDDINSKEASENFSDIIAFSDADPSEFTSPQKAIFKRMTGYE